jgi:hypothetical protein
MKKFRVQINAYQYHADFTVESEDSAEGIENAIIDRLGKSDIKWEYLGEMMDPRVNRITYEEVISQIKLAEAEKADAQNKIDAAAPQVSVAT